MKKFIVRVFAILAAVVVVAVTVLYFTINSIIASEIESAGTDALGVKTTVGSFRLSLFDESTTITGLNIANPPGYDGRFLSLDRGSIAVNLGSVFSDRVEIRDISLEGIELDLVESLKGSNVGVIIDHTSSDSDAPSDPSTDDSSTDDSGGQKYIIDSIMVKDVEVKISIEPVTSQREPTTLKIRQIKVTDIGKKEGGVPLDQVATIVVHSIVAAATKAAPGEMPRLLLTTMEGGLSSLTHVDLGGVQVDLGKGLANVVGGLSSIEAKGEDAVGDVLKGIGDALGGGDSKK